MQNSTDFRFNTSDFRPLNDLAAGNTALGIEYDGNAPGAYAGYDVDFCDVDGNGKLDQVYNIVFASSMGRTLNGEITVIFDSQSTVTITPQVISSVATFRVLGSQSNAALGINMGCGDGYLVVNEPSLNTNTGAVHFILVGPSRSGNLDLASATPAQGVYTIHGENLGDVLGTYITFIPHGTVVCAYAAQGYRGRCYFLRKHPDFLQMITTTPLSSWNSTYVLRVDGYLPGDYLAYATMVGDLKGKMDGSYYVALQSSEAYGQKGAIYLFECNDILMQMGYRTVNDLVSDPSKGFVIRVLNNEGRIGYYVVSGDLNRDGKNDLVITYYGETFANRTNAGVMRVYYGSATIGMPSGDLNSTEASVTIGGAHPNDFAGASPTLTDLDGDGNLEICAGETGLKVNGQANAGGVSLVRLQFLSDNQTVDLAVVDGRGVTQFIAASNVDERLGHAIAPPVADWDGDGLNDTLFTAYSGRPNNLINAGRVYGVRGDSTPVMNDPTFPVQQEGRTVLNSTMLRALRAGRLDPKVKFRPVNPQHGYYSFQSTPTQPITTFFTQQQVIAGEVGIQHDGGIIPFSCDMIAFTGGLARDSAPKTCTINFSLKPPVINYLPVFLNRATPITTANLDAGRTGVTFIVSVTSGGKFNRISDITDTAITNFTDAEIIPPTNIEINALGTLPTGTVVVSDGQYRSNPVALGTTTVSTPQCLVNTLNVQPNDESALLTYRADGTGTFRCIDMTQTNPSLLKVIFGGIKNANFRNLLNNNIPQNLYTQAVAAQGAVGIFFGKAAHLIFEAADEILYNVSSTNDYDTSVPQLGRITCTACNVGGAINSAGIPVVTYLAVIGPSVAVALCLGGGLKWKDNNNKIKSKRILDDKSKKNVENNAMHPVGRTWLSNDLFRKFIGRVIDNVFEGVSTRPRMGTRTDKDNVSYFNAITYVINEARVTQPLYEALTEKEQGMVIDAIAEKIKAVAEASWRDWIAWRKPWLYADKLSAQATAIGKNVVKELAKTIEAFKQVQSAMNEEAGHKLAAAMVEQEKQEQKERRERKEQAEEGDTLDEENTTGSTTEGKNSRKSHLSQKRMLNDVPSEEASDPDEEKEREGDPHSHHEGEFVIKEESGWRSWLPAFLGGTPKPGSQSVKVVAGRDPLKRMKHAQASSMHELGEGKRHQQDLELGNRFDSPHSPSSVKNKEGAKSSASPSSKVAASGAGSAKSPASPSSSVVTEGGKHPRASDKDHNSLSLELLKVAASPADDAEEPYSADNNENARSPASSSSKAAVAGGKHPRASNNDHNSLDLPAAEVPSADVVSPADPDQEYLYEPRETQPGMGDVESESSASGASSPTMRPSSPALSEASIATSSGGLNSGSSNSSGSGYGVPLHFSGGVARGAASPKLPVSAATSPSSSPGKESSGSLSFSARAKELETRKPKPGAAPPVVVSAEPAEKQPPKKQARKVT